MASWDRDRFLLVGFPQNPAQFLFVQRFSMAFSLLVKQALVLPIAVSNSPSYSKNLMKSGRVFAISSSFSLGISVGFASKGSGFAKKCGAHSFFFESFFEFLVHLIISFMFFPSKMSEHPPKLHKVVPSYPHTSQNNRYFWFIQNSINLLDKSPYRRAQKSLDVLLTIHQKPLLCSP